MRFSPLVWLLALPAFAGDAQTFVRTYCVACHQGKSPSAGLDLTKLKDVTANPAVWSRMLARVRDGQMPPIGARSPEPAERLDFVTWVDHTLRQSACADGIDPGRAPVRRLNRSEY